MKIIKRLAVILTTAVVIILLVFKLKSNKETVETYMYRHDPLALVLVDAEAVQFRNIAGDKHYTGFFEPFREGKVMSEAQGKITWLGISEGDFVSTGQLVARIDNTLLQLQLQALDVQIEGHLSDIQRYEVLTPSDAIPGIQLEKTKLALKAAHVQRKTLQEQINRTSVKAPFSGFITLKMVETGTVIGPGMPIAQITDISSLKLTIHVPETELSGFQNNQNFAITAEALPGKTLAGKLSLIASKGDAAHNFAVQVLIKNPQPQSLKAGMYGTLILPTSQESSVLSIPHAAITGSVQEAKVFLVEEGRASLRDVKLGTAGEQYVTIIEGVKAGEMVVTSGLINLKNGTPVRVRE